MQEDIAIFTLVFACAHHHKHTLTYFSARWLTLEVFTFFFFFCCVHFVCVQNDNWPWCAHFLSVFAVELASDSYTLTLTPRRHRGRIAFNLANCWPWCASKSPMKNGKQPRAIDEEGKENIERTKRTNGVFHVRNLTAHY